MFGKNKRIWYVLMSLMICCGLFSVSYTNAATFSEKLADIGLDIATFSEKNSISRYEVTRLLNAANCEDCIQSPIWMQQTYNQSFWDNFRAIDGKDFNDVDYQWWVWNKKSYYYCVAYVWDNGYMAWYPNTSTKCQWKFCGQESITTSEFYQTVLNIIQDQIRWRYQIDRSKVKSWKKWLKKNSVQMKVLNQNNIDIIDKAESKVAYAQNNDEFQTWLKYCMYNLSACNFQSFWVIWTGYWPVSELNILYKEWIITMDDAIATASFSNLKWSEAIRIFSQVYDNYANCSFNVDYDCDWIVNGKDNCPYLYNSNQYDMDGNGIWNVCDDDIDWDWEKNPIWIVDDNNRIVIKLWGNEFDQTPLGDSDLWFSFFINVDAISTSFPTTVRLSPLTNWDIEKIEWDFWDWTKQVVDNWNKISHSFQTVWTFIVKAVATAKNGAKSFAMNKIFISTPKSDNYVLNLSPSGLFKNWIVEYTITPIYDGGIDTIKWSVNNWEEISQKVDEKFKTTIKSDGLYVINAKWYANWQLKAVAALSITKNWSPSFAAMNFKVWNLWENTSVITSLVWVDRKDVNRIAIDWWWKTTNSTDLSQSFKYEEAWLKTIQQTVYLKNWTTLRSMGTITIQNPLLTQSYAMNIWWKRLAYDTDEKMSLNLNVYPKSSVLSLFTSYQAWQKKILYNPNLAQIVLDYAYRTAWDKILTNSVDVNRCVALTNQWTVHINSVDVCLQDLKDWKLSKYKCDQDGDGIPDICDDDIDWDGVKNFVWIITRENKDCSIDSNNIKSDLFQQQFWICSLDNCPFNPNSDQTDLNNNWVWDICDDESFRLLEISSKNGDTEIVVLTHDDLDQDWVEDSKDACVDVPWNSFDGCPENYTRNCWVYSTCGNGVVDKWETCKNCPQDVWVCCGNWVKDEWEDCNTCPVDFWECGLCGNEKIDEWEDCKNCSQDVWECSAWCGNGKIEEWEDCKNCSKDVKICKSSTCGDGKIDKESWEECDNWKNNGKDKKCTKSCTKYQSDKPDCGNGEIDEWEDCKTCPVDLWEKCVAEWEKNKCGNGDVDEWETCKNCEKDVWKCSAWCGNGEIEPAEDCRNCERDVWKCSAWCGNGKIEEWEDCKNCSKDVKMCKSSTCGDGKVDKEAWEECDNWKNNGKDKKCTKSCTKYQSDKPNCGNGEIDEWEDCKTCPVDLWEKCVDWWNQKNCGNWVKDEWEECDMNDKTQKNWWVNGCSNSCQKIGENSWICNSDYDWKVLVNLTTSSNLCLKWVAKKFVFDVENVGWSWICIDETSQNFVKCIAQKSICWDFVVWDDEYCFNCPEDLKDICVDNGDDGVIPDDETDDTEEPEDREWNITNEDCNSCPCEYADFSTDLAKWDTVRAKLWDKKLSAFYKNSNSLSLESFLGSK